MNFMISTVMARGQITVPKKMREKHGLMPGTAVQVMDEGDGVKVKPMISQQFIIPPKYTREEYKKVLEKIAKGDKVLWTKSDDRRRAESLRREEEKWKKLAW